MILWEREYSLAAGIPGVVQVFYLPHGYPLGHMLPEALMGYQRSPWDRPLPLTNDTPCIQIEPSVQYRAYFHNPRTGEDVRCYWTKGAKQVTLGVVEPSPDGLWPTPMKPTMEDWVLVLESRDYMH